MFVNIYTECFGMSKEKNTFYLKKLLLFFCYYSNRKDEKKVELMDEQKREKMEKREFQK